jgi:TPR repeat protein
VAVTLAAGLAVALPSVASATTSDDVATLRVAAEAGQASAQYWYGHFLDEEAGDKPTAVLWYGRAADQGHHEAELRLAQMMERGDGIPVDPVTARDFYERAAKAGIPTAQFNLALMYEDGRGGARDTEAAVHWYRAAAVLSHGRAAN